MNSREIIRKYLKENNYDGLFCDGECGCQIDDLFPCWDGGLDCEPGYKIECNKDDDCPICCGGDWHIGLK